MIAKAVQVLERPVRVCPLGMRFWDTATQSVVADGLTVTAHRRAGTGRRVRAFTNRSGVYAFADLPGLRGFEFGLKETVGSPAPSSFVIEVADALGRFLPFQLTTLPPVRGLFRWAEESGSPLSPVAEGSATPADCVPLFSSPARLAPVGVAVVRAELRQPGGEAAAWAVLEVHHAGRLLGRSYADERGLAAVMFAYPELLERWPGSPAGGTKLPLADHEWPVAISARYGRVAPIPSRGMSAADPAGAGQRLPDLDAIFRQPRALVELDVSPRQPLPALTLKYGRDLVLRSRHEPMPISHLLITAGSPI